MNYCAIRKDDILNGEGLRVVLFVNGCDHNCYKCHNPQTWNAESGKNFDYQTKMNLMYELSKDYISGITLSGGDPLYKDNLIEISELCFEVKRNFPKKTIWIYTGYKFEDIYFWVNTSDFQLERDLRIGIIQKADVLVDGTFNNDLSDVKYQWAGSTNQRVIDIKKTLSNRKITLYQ